MVIDIFANFGWIIPLKDRTGKSVANAFEKIFKERMPNKIWVDNGKIFYDKDVKSYWNYIQQKMKRNLVLLRYGLEQ